MCPMKPCDNKGKPALSSTIIIELLYMLQPDFSSQVGLVFSRDFAQILKALIDKIEIVTGPLLK